MLQTRSEVGGICLRDVLPQARVLGGDDFRVRSVCSDSRRCQPGDLFVALLGQQHDGHDFVDEAIGRGAAAVLAERLLPVRTPQLLVDDTREAYGNVCQALAGRPSEALHAVGVTGTSGKTTTGLLITAVLEAAERRVGITGSLGYCDGIETAPAAHTTPPAPELAQWLAQMRANGCSHAVVEASSQALAQRRLAGVELDAAVLTNVRRAHLDYHGSVVNYRNAKGRLFDCLKPNGFVVINADDQASNFFLSRLKHPVMTVGMHNPAELTATVVERFNSEQTFLLEAGCETIPVRTRTIGDDYVYCCLMATAVGLVTGIELPTIVRGLESLEHIPGHLERIDCGQPYGVFVDNACTSDALVRVLKTLREVTSKRLICVFGADSHADQRERPHLGRAVERFADLGVITSDNASGEEPLQMAHDILDGYDRPARAHLLPDREKAICWALGEARPGDTVLVAGSRTQEYQLTGGQRYSIDDREVARHWLYEIGAKVASPWAAA